MYLAQASLSPNFGAPATPVPWQAEQVDWKTCSPVLRTLGASASTSLKPATGWMRRAMASSDWPSDPAPVRMDAPTRLTSRMMTAIGIRKARMTVISN